MLWGKLKEVQFLYIATQTETYIHTLSHSLTQTQTHTHTHTHTQTHVCHKHTHTYTLTLCLSLPDTPTADALCKLTYKNVFRHDIPITIYQIVVRVINKYIACVNVERIFTFKPTLLK